MLLDDIPQDAVHHPEGNALEHTIYAVEAMRDIINREGLYAQEHILMPAALCHDLGKATTTVIHNDGRITAYGHEAAGVEPTIALLQRILMPNEVINRITPLVRYHMHWVGFFTDEITPRSIRRLATKLLPATMEQWALIVEADISGRPPKEKGLPEKAYKMLLLARELGINEGIE
jgi:tRNA nucleotidyltransferase (CCA-adding enzyme)